MSYIMEVEKAVLRTLDDLRMAYKEQAYSMLVSGKQLERAECYAAASEALQAGALAVKTALRRFYEVDE